MARALWVDPFSGLSGDIWVGGFLALGADPQEFHSLLSGLPFPDLALSVREVVRCGVRATKASVVIGGKPDQGGTPHLLPEGSKRVLRRGKASGPAHGATWAEVDQLLARHLPGRVAEVARGCFRRLAAAEAAIHGSPVESVHFHEVGLQDSVADVALAAAGWIALGEPEIHVGPLALGSGRTRMAHGNYPIPGPATLLLLEGFETGTGVAPVDRELTTPTGAAIACQLAVGRRTPPRFVPAKVGFGAGGWDFPDSPNVARFVLGEIPAGSAEIIQVESNLDDATPQQVAHAQTRMLECGALDAWVVPATFKKGRSGWVLGALVPRGRLEAICQVLGSELPTLGIRSWPVQRLEAERDFLASEIEGREVAVKRGRWPWAEHLQPEFEDARKAAEQLQQPLHQIQAKARDRAKARK